MPDKMPNFFPFFLTKSRVFGIFIHVGRRKEVVKLDDLKVVLLTVLGNIISYLIERAIEKKSAHRKGRPKHMR